MEVSSFNFRIRPFPRASTLESLKFPVSNAINKNEHYKKKKKKRIKINKKSVCNLSYDDGNHIFFMLSFQYNKLSSIPENFVSHHTFISLSQVSADWY